MMISASTSTRSRLCARRGAGVRRAVLPGHVIPISFFLLLRPIAWIYCQHRHHAYVGRRMLVSYRPLAHQTRA
jgi:hypothetical protein